MDPREAKRAKQLVGYVHQDLLAAKPPTVEAIVARADALKAKGADDEVTMLWRAWNLARERKDLYDRLLAAAFASSRWDVAVDAFRASCQSPSWKDATVPARFESAESLRAYLYRLSVGRLEDALRPLLEDLGRVQTNEYNEEWTVPMLEWVPFGRRTRMEALFEEVCEALAQQGERGEAFWRLGRLELSRHADAGWRITRFDFVEVPPGTPGRWSWESP